MKKWKCTVCGYVHTGPEPPEKCPVCGADKSKFVLLEEEPEATEKKSAPDDNQKDQEKTILKWRCTVCGYIHTGPEPPEKCPVCGADKTKFVPAEESPGTTEEEKAPESAEPADHKTIQKWRCTVCGYIHTGPEPPEKCPVCGADKSKFVPVEEPAEETDDSAEQRPESSVELSRYAKIYQKGTELMVQNHAHPISVHIPNGVVPVAVLFLFLARIFQSPALEIAAFYNMVVVLLAMPAVIFAGYVDWQKKFGGHMTSVFKGKIGCAAALTGLTFIVVIWRIWNPAAAIGPQASNGYLALHVIILAIGAVAGFLGGKLVFNQN